MRWVKLEECCTVQGGATPKRNVGSFWGEGLDWFTPKDLSSLNTKEIGRAPEQVTDEGLNSCSAKLIPANSLLLSSRAPIGHLAITTQDCCTNQGFQSLIPKQGVVDIEYLYFVMKWSVPRLQDMGRGATFKEISKAIVKGFEIPLPPLEEQKRIAGILDEADRVRKKTKALIDKYDELAQSLFLDMFGDPVTNPKGWDMIPLRKVCPLKRGYDLPVGSRRLGEIPVYGGNGQIGVHSEHKASGPGVVTGRSGTLGVVHYCFEDFWPLNTALYVTDFFDNEPKWISVMLAHFGLERFSRGAGVPTLNRNLVHDELVPNVPNRIQREFCSRSE